MNLSAFRNPLVIAAIVGAGILSSGITYIGGDCSQARAQAQRQAIEKAAFERLLTPGKQTDPKKFETNPFNFGRSENNNE